jgi:recombination protein RecA
MTLGPGARTRRGRSRGRGGDACREGNTGVAKNKCAPPFTEAEFEIRWGTGIDSNSELIDLGIARGLVDKAGNHLSFAGSPLGNGRERSRDTVGGSSEIQSTLRQAIMAAGPVRPGRRVEAEA